MLPGGGALNPLNDARYYELNEVHLTWATAHGLNPDLAGWIFNHKPGLATGDVGEPIPTILWFREPNPAFAPAQVLPLAKVFPGRGLVHVRSGWDALDLMSSFEARHADWGETIHQNQDVNAFTLYAYGARLAIDSGYANYLEKILLGQDFEAARSSQTEAHNAVDIDGRTQDFHGKGALRRFVSTATVGSPGAVDVAVGDARLAWLTVQPRRADRYFIHVRGEDGRPGYLVIGDAVQGFGPKRLDHDYRWFLQTEPGNQLVTTGPSSALVTAPNGVRLDVTMASAAPTTASVDTFTADYADIGAHPRLVIRSRAPRLEALTALGAHGALERGANRHPRARQRWRRHRRGRRHHPPAHRHDRPRRRDRHRRRAGLPAPRGRVVPRRGNAFEHGRASARRPVGGRGERHR